jgi:hypothetical protein
MKKITDMQCPQVFTHTATSAQLMGRAWPIGGTNVTVMNNVQHVLYCASKCSGYCLCSSFSFSQSTGECRIAVGINVITNYGMLVINATFNTFAKV